MGLPNATSMLTCLPGGLRVTLSRGGVVASCAVRFSKKDSGALSMGGLTPQMTTPVWTLAADFNPMIRVGDVLTVGSETAFVIEAMLSSGNLVNRANVVICSETVEIDGATVACNLAGVSQDVFADIGGFRPDDVQGFFIPLSLLPNPGKMIKTGDSVTLSGSVFSVERVSMSHDHNVLCVTCSRKGAPRNG